MKKKYENFKDLVVSLKLSSIDNEKLVEIIPEYLDYTIDKFFSSVENFDRVHIEKKRFFVLLNSILPRIDADIFSKTPSDFLEFLSRKINSYIKTEYDQVFFIASGHLMLLSFYIDRCKAYNIDDPYEMDNLEGNYDMYDRKYFEGVDYMDYKNLINMDNDLLYDYFSVNVLHKISVKKDEYLELFQELFLLLAIIFAGGNKEKTSIIYKEIAEKRISLSTPILSNLRTLHFKNTASCFVMKLQDDLKNIFTSISNVANISRAGGGVGVNLSSVRSKGSSVAKRRKVALGVVNICRILDVITSSISQGGKRNAAITVALDIWHIEISEFLEIGLESGDNRMKCFDIFPQVVVSDTFMRKVEKREMWYLLDPKNIKDVYDKDLTQLISKDFEEFYEKIVSDIRKGDERIVYKEFEAVSLMKKIIQSQVETGLPYIFFKDTANLANPNIYDGRIFSGNLCQESFSNFGLNEDNQNLYHTCNLLSLNLSNILDEKTLENSCRISVSILNSLFNFSNTLKESDFHNMRYRTIGIGALGLHDHLAYKNIFFGSDESIKYVDKLFHLISYFVNRESVEWAKNFSSFPAYKKSMYKKGYINGRTLDELKEDSKRLSLDVDWDGLFLNMKKYGIYNSHLLAIAPNTNTSILQNASAGVLPIYSKFFIDNNSHSLVYTFPRYILTNQEAYIPYFDLDLKKVVELISTIQKYIDQGISFELLFDINKNITAKYIKNIIFFIWKRGCKTIYYTRTLQRVVDKELCESCTI